MKSDYISLEDQKKLLVNLYERLKLLRDDIHENEDILKSLTEVEGILPKENNSFLLRGLRPSLNASYCMTVEYKRLLDKKIKHLGLIQHTDIS